MTTKPNDGGAAFPTSPDNAANPAEGMTLRDYFAAAALTGIIRAEGACNLLNGLPEYTLQENSAHVAYKYADAMLKARSQC